MSSPHDDTPPPTWTAPGSAAPPPASWTDPGSTPPAAPQAPSGPPVAPPYPPAPQGWSSPQAWSGQPGWAAAPPPGAWRPPTLQPGIIPLRPLGLGEILDGAFKAIRANPRVMFGLSALVATVAVAIQSVITWYLGGILTDDLLDATSSSAYSEDLSSTFGSTLANFIALPITSLATTVLTGWLIVSVSRSVLGQKVAASAVLRNRKIWSVVGFTAAVAVAAVVAVALVAVPVVALAANDQVGAAVALGLLGSVVLLVVAIWFGVRTLLVPPAIMLEGKPLRPTVARAWRLTYRSFWRLLGIYLLVSILASIVTQFVVTPAALISAFVFDDPTMESFGSILVSGVAEVIAMTLSTAFLAAVVALLYIDVRMRREGLDVELARASDPTR